jgi:hypothetical protein
MLRLLSREREGKEGSSYTQGREKHCLKLKAEGLFDPYAFTVARIIFNIQCY